MSDHTIWATSPLTADRIDQAYPLMLAGDPSLTLEAWREMAHRHLHRPGSDTGIVTLRRGGYIHGLFCYHVECNADDGATLRVDVIRFLDIADQRNADRIMRAAMSEVAREAGCSVLQLPAGDGQSGPLPDIDRPASGVTGEGRDTGGQPPSHHRTASRNSRRKG